MEANWAALKGLSKDKAKMEERISAEGSGDALRKSRKPGSDREDLKKREAEAKTAKEAQNQASVPSLEYAAERNATKGASGSRVLTFRVKRSDLGVAAQRLAELGARAAVLQEQEADGLPEPGKADAREKTPNLGSTRQARPENARPEHDEEWVLLTVTLVEEPPPAEPTAP